MVPSSSSFLSGFFISISSSILAFFYFLTKLGRRKTGREENGGERKMPESIPEEVIIELLSRLPSKSLVRFRAVCKAWNTLIGDTHFISKHLHQYSPSNDKNNGGSVLVNYCCPFSHTNVVLLLSSDTHDAISIFRLPCEMNFESMKVVGSCNGLLCVTDDENGSSMRSRIVLWNPSIRKLRVLPKCGVGSANLCSEKVSGVVLGFGYHPIVDDYRIVRIVSLQHFGRSCFRAEVYSLRTDSWIEIDAMRCRIYESYCVALNGVLYWIAFGRGVEDYEFILSFDMSDWVFRRIELPDFNFSEDGICTRLAVLKESLYLITYNHRGRQKVFDVWLRNGHGDWTRELTIGPLFGIEKPLGFDLYGRVYMKNHKGKLDLYNPSTQEITHLPTHGLSHTLEVFCYKESIVSTDQRLEVVE
ncbi:Galactose oxidase [Parasponia andersonii]|uniref:Galactose oxidase n=1 Tax=Parasponia andersonii TaxID=3476 RepID=A0A2P5AP42_PARAD|nr:Galactose oxidase [Parasponia andersonii]